MYLARDSSTCFSRLPGLGADRGLCLTALALPDINFLCSIPFLANLSESLWPVSPQTASCRPSFCLYRPCTQHCDLVALLSVCLSELTTFAKSNDLAIRQWMWCFFCLNGVSPHSAHRRDIAFSHPSHGTIQRPCF
jgi:hypothetical protein